LRISCGAGRRQQHLACLRDKSDACVQRHGVVVGVRRPHADDVPIRSRDVLVDREFGELDILGKDVDQARYDGGVFRQPVGARQNDLELAGTAKTSA